MREGTGNRCVENDINATDMILLSYINLNASSEVIVCSSAS